MLYVVRRNIKIGVCSDPVYTDCNTLSVGYMILNINKLAEARGHTVPFIFDLVSKYGLVQYSGCDIYEEASGYRFSDVLVREGVHIRYAHEGEGSRAPA